MASINIHRVTRKSFDKVPLPSDYTISENRGIPNWWTKRIVIKTELGELFEVCLYCTEVPKGTETNTDQPDPDLLNNFAKLSRLYPGESAETLWEMATSEVSQ